MVVAQGQYFELFTYINVQVSLCKCLYSNPNFSLA
jgi:hypothetical protein